MRIFKYLFKSYALIKFLLFALVEFIKANFNVALIILKPQLKIQPCVFALPLNCRKPVELALLAGIITLTPGSLALEISKDRRWMFIHLIAEEGSNEKMIKELKEKYELPLKQIFG